MTIMIDKLPNIKEVLETILSKLKIEEIHTVIMNPTYNGSQSFGCRYSTYQNI